MEDINLKGGSIMKTLLKYIVICDIMIYCGAFFQRLSDSCGIAILDNLGFKGENNHNYQAFVKYGNKWMERFKIFK